MKKLFRKRDVAAPGYPTHQAVGLKGRAVVAAGVLVVVAGAACDIGGQVEGGMPPPAIVDAGPGPDGGAGGVAMPPDASFR